MASPHLNIDELWIGEKVRLVKSGREGVFAGKSQDGRARISFDGNILLTEAQNLEIVEDKGSEELPHFWEKELKPIKKAPQISLPFSPEIDLHLEKLPNNMRTSPLASKIDLQLEACRNHIETAITRKQVRILIIHGKGEGILRQMVHQMLDGYREVKWKFVTNQGGATEVLFW
ncbi:MAG: Smr/MutS family protein [Saprospiraceae bacterium]|nr:Smr/MutS family protein [Saprospiraceae bacterium]